MYVSVENISLGTGKHIHFLKKNFLSFFFLVNFVPNLNRYFLLSSLSLFPSLDSNFYSFFYSLEPLYIGSMWSKMNITHRAMFISTCIIGTIVFVFMFIVFIYVIHKRKDAVVRYYRLRKRQKSKKYHFMIFDSEN